MKFLFYSHDALGLGHTRRHLAIAAALTQSSPEASVLLVSGADDVVRFHLPPRVEVLKLPAIRKNGNTEYIPRRLNISRDANWRLRSAVLHAAIDSFRPRVILVDKHPFGALGELTQSLHMIRDYGGRAVLGLRDILDEPGRVKNEWASQDFFSKVNSFYDLVLVYGERSVFDPVNEYQMPDEVAQNVRFCGYVVGCEVHKDQGASTDSISAKLETRKVPAVLATAGGGEDGFELIETFLKASAGAPWEGIAVAGPMTPEHEALRLQELARRAKVTLHSFLPHLSNLYWSVDCLVCMGGYNTLAEGVSRGVPIVCVPRVTPRSEQSLRAHAFERLGLLRAVAPDQLSVQAMRQSILRTLGSSRQGLLDRARQVLTFDGARQAASHLLALAAIASDAKVSSQVVAV